MFLVTEDWYFWSHRLPVARAARDAGAKVIVASRMRCHEARILSEGFFARNVSFDRSGFNVLRDIGTLFTLVSLLRREKPDLLHNVAAKPVLYGSVAAWITRVPAVVNAMAGLGFLFMAQSIRAKIVRGTFGAIVSSLSSRANARLIVQNDDDRQVFIRAGLKPHHIVVIPGSGVDTAWFSPSVEPEGVPVAICVSRMLRDKGIIELVEAARLLRARGVPLIVRLVGGADANPSSIPQATIDAWANEGAVEVAGHSTDIAGEYARSHIAVLPSYREGLPKSLLEAAACARPIVATDVPGCREICIDNESGLLVSPKNVEGLAAALEALALDREERLRMGKNARFMAEQRFSSEAIQQSTLELYSFMLGRMSGFRK